MAARTRTKRPSSAMTRFMAEMFRPLGGTRRTTRRGVVMDRGNASSSYENGWAADGGDATSTYSRTRVVGGGGV